MASSGGVSDYYGITWEKIDERNGIFWPCPEIGHPGTPRLYEGGKFGHPDGKAHFIPIEWRPSAEIPTTSIPSSSRPAASYRSSCRARRRAGSAGWWTISSAVGEIHPRLAENLASRTGIWSKSRAAVDSIVVPAKVVKTIRPDTVFIPYHWPHDRCANNLTIRAIDPDLNIPEFKICAVRRTQGRGADRCRSPTGGTAGGIR